MMSFQYCLGASENLESMLLMLAKESVLGATISANAISEPILIPDMGIWLPMATSPGTVFETVEDYNDWYDNVHCPAAGINPKTAVTIGIILQEVPYQHQGRMPLRRPH